MTQDNMRALLECTEYLETLFKLRANGLAISGPERFGFIFPQPGHPDVIKWRQSEHDEIDNEIFDRAWLLCECRQLIAEATDDYEAMGRIMAVALRIPFMEMSEVQQQLEFFHNRERELHFKGQE
jgi:hypothetical protein